MRQPLKLLFKPPATLGRWRLTGRLNQPRPSYGVVPCCEWINDEDGDRIWMLPTLMPVLAAEPGSRTDAQGLTAPIALRPGSSPPE
jgi:hypothetical protein